MPKITVKEYAVHRGVAWRSIYRYIQDKLIPESALSRDGKMVLVDPVKADKALDRHITTRKQLLQKVDVEGEQVEPGTKAGNLSFHEARTLSQRVKAVLLKIDLEERTGKLVESAAVRTAAFNTARTLRDALMNIPDRISVILAAETDQSKVSALLAKEIRQALDELSSKE